MWGRKNAVSQRVKADWFSASRNGFSAALKTNANGLIMMTNSSATMKERTITLLRTLYRWSVHKKLVYSTRQGYFSCSRVQPRSDRFSPAQLYGTLDGC